MCSRVILWVFIFQVAKQRCKWTPTRYSSKHKNRTLVKNDTKWQFLPVQRKLPSHSFGIHSFVSSHGNHIITSITTSALIYFKAVILLGRTRNTLGKCYHKMAIDGIRLCMWNCMGSQKLCVVIYVCILPKTNSAQRILSLILTLLSTSVAKCCHFK